MTFISNLCRILYLFPIIIIISLSMFQHGYNRGVINAPYESITKCTIPPGQMEGISNIMRDCIPMTTLQWSFAVGMNSFGGLFSAPLAPWISDFVSRRNILFYAALTNIFGIFMMVVFSEFSTFMVGRFFSGLASGIYYGVTSMYLVEIAPPKVRGIVAGFSGVGVTTGLLLQSILSIFLSGTGIYWRILLSGSAVASIIQVLTLPLIPHSPRWLMLKYTKLALKYSRMQRDLGRRFLSEEQHDIEEDGKCKELPDSVSIQFDYNTPHVPSQSKMDLLAEKNDDSENCIRNGMLSPSESNLISELLNEDTETNSRFFIKEDKPITDTNGDLQASSSIQDVQIAEYVQNLKEDKSITDTKGIVQASRVMQNIRDCQFVEANNNREQMIEYKTAARIPRCTSEFKSNEEDTKNDTDIKLKTNISENSSQLTRRLPQRSLFDVPNRRKRKVSEKDEISLPTLYGGGEFLHLPSSIQLYKHSAIKALAFYRSGHIDDDVMREIDEIEFETRDSLVNSKGYREVFNRRVIWKIVVATILQVSIELCGSAILSAYSQMLFDQSGISRGDIWNVIIFFFDFLGSVLCGFAFDRIGRRKSLIISQIFLLFGITLFAISFAFLSVHITFVILCIISMVGVIFFFSIGLAPLAILISVEMFSNTTRGIGMSIASLSNWLIMTIVIFTFPSFMEWAGRVAIVPFVIINLFFLVFFLLFVPETKGKLEKVKIEVSFDDGQDDHGTVHEYIGNSNCDESHNNWVESKESPPSQNSKAHHHSNFIDNRDPSQTSQ